MELESDLQYFAKPLVSIFFWIVHLFQAKKEAWGNNTWSFISAKDFVRAFPIGPRMMKIKTCTVINQPFMPDQHIGVSKRSVDISDKS
jgi:hypothetical protein